MAYDYSPPIASFAPSSISGWYDVKLDGETVETVDRVSIAIEICNTITRLGWRARRAFMVD